MQWQIDVREHLISSDKVDAESDVTFCANCSDFVQNKSTYAIQISAHLLSKVRQFYHAVCYEKLVELPAKQTQTIKRTSVLD